MNGLFGKCSAGIQQQFAMQNPFDFQRMSDERMGMGFEPIEWPKIIANICRAEALKRPLTVCEKLLYRGALAALAEEQ